MENTNGYKSNYEKKNQRLDIRLDMSMVQRIKEIRKKTGISVSEIIRESVRRLLQEVDSNGNINLMIN